MMRTQNERITSRWRRAKRTQFILRVNIDGGGILELVGYGPEDVERLVRASEKFIAAYQGARVR